MKYKIKHSGAFTLVEVAVVITIILIIAALSLPSLSSLTNSDQLNLAAREVNNLLAMARSEAIDAGVPVQVRFVTDKWQTATDDYSYHFRRASLWKYVPPTSPTDTTAHNDLFVQITMWQTLPEGIVIEPDPTGSSNAKYYSFITTDPTDVYFRDSTIFGSTNSDTIMTNFSTTGGVTFDAAAFEFTPNGGLHIPSSAPSLPYRVYLLLVEGFMPNNAATEPVPIQQEKNWAQIRVTTLTGRISIVRP